VINGYSLENCGVQKCGFEEIEIHIATGHSYGRYWNKGTQTVHRKHVVSSIDIFYLLFVIVSVFFPH